MADVVFDPWLEHQPIKLYGPEDFAAKISTERADIVICEADSCKGPVLDCHSQPSPALEPVPTTSTSTGPRPQASRCCTRRAATPTRWRR